MRLLAQANSEWSWLRAPLKFLYFSMKYGTTQWDMKTHSKEHKGKQRTDSQEDSKKTQQKWKSSYQQTRVSWTVKRQEREIFFFSFVVKVKICSRIQYIYRFIFPFQFSFDTF